MALTLLPALDIAGGRAAQVVGQGDTDPGQVAAGWVRAGASWLHVVDLDKAFGRGDNSSLLAELVAATDVPVQLSGGLVDEEDIEAALASGAARVVLSSLALRDPELVTELVRAHGERLAVGIDLADGGVVARGTDARIGRVDDVLRWLSRVGPAVVVVADASRDGSRHGADVSLFQRVADDLPGEVVASGGVASLDDVRRLRDLAGSGSRVSAVVLGAALYHGAFTLQEALAVASGDEP